MNLHGAVVSSLTDATFGVQQPCACVLLCNCVFLCFEYLHFCVFLNLCTHSNNKFSTCGMLKVWVHRHSCTCDLQITKPIHFFNSNCENTVVSCVGVNVLIFHYRIH